MGVRTAPAPLPKLVEPVALAHTVLFCSELTLPIWITPPLMVVGPYRPGLARGRTSVPAPTLFRPPAVAPVEPGRLLMAVLNVTVLPLVSMPAFTLSAMGAK